MISNGGRDGRVFSPDNTFVQNLATPKEMGGQIKACTISSSK
jgi:osmotically inducible protein OsmC